MAEDNARQAEESGVPEIERKLDRSGGSSYPRGDQRIALRVKDRPEEDRLPTPPPYQQCPSDAMRDRSGMMPRGVEEEEEDLAVYGLSPFEDRSFDYDVTPNSAASAMEVDPAPFTDEDVFEHLDRLYALTREILELRDRSYKHFRRVRNLQRAKVQRNADRRLGIAVANGEELLDFINESTGFAESLLDAMLSNCRDTAVSAAMKRSEHVSARSPPSSRRRSRSIALTGQSLGLNLVGGASKAKKRTAKNANRNSGGPKISKWTRVKAAFKWERACTSDLADIVETAMPTTRFLRIPDVITTGSWSTGSALSPCTSELSSSSTPTGRVSSASSSNEEMFDDSRKSVINYVDRQLALAKDDRRKEDPNWHCRSLDTFIAENADPAESSIEASRDKPLIRIISDADAAIVNTGKKNPEVSTKKSTPILTITIPSNEEEMRNLSSPESMSPLLSSAQNSGGSSPQQPKPRQGVSSLREFKQQCSTIEEAVAPAPKIQQQDSKWNKVRRAFLTNATFSVPVSPIRMVAPQSISNDDTRRARSKSVEDKTITGTSNNSNNHCQAETSKDYRALREKFGAEFYRKLVEWERLKSARNARNDILLSEEERLAPEFRKKLQEWKRAKKGRRSGAAIEQQRVSRRRLTDWQLWRTSPSKSEAKFCGKNQNSIGSRGSCASIGRASSFGSDGKQHLCEDFIKRMEAWRRISEPACRNNERPKSPASRVASDIDEAEFLPSEKKLLLSGQESEKQRRESDAKQLNDCFDGDSRFMNASRGVNRGNEVFVRTSVGSYRFEGISREFTRKLYDWEKYRGISPKSSTFRLLGPDYTPFTQDSNKVILAEPSRKNRIPLDQFKFHFTLKRSKSDGGVFKSRLLDESFILRRSTSLQSSSFADKLENDNQLETLPISSNNSQEIKNRAEDIGLMEDTEPEAMIIDIEDVIEETASPLMGVQPYQTPVYSVAASETTSIAVPLGTVTSSHEPSPVFLVEAEENENCKRWNDRTWQIDSEARSSENSPSPERSPVSKNWHETMMSVDEDKSNWESWRKESNKEDDDSGWTEKTRYSIPDSGDSVKSDYSIGWNRDFWNESGDETNRDSTLLDFPLTSIYKIKSDTKKHDLFENVEARSANSADNFETSLKTLNAEELTDSPRTSRRMNETRKLEIPADKPSNKEQTSDMEDLQDDEKTERRRIILDTYQLARTPSSDCRDFKKAFAKLSNLNSDDNKNVPEYCGVDIEEVSAHYENCSSPEDVDRHYEILTFKTDVCGDTIGDNRLYEPINCPEIRSFICNGRNNCANENLLSSRLPRMEKSNYLETSRSLLTNSIIRTIPITVSRDNEARHLEKILINEETLNKIIVPTASVKSGIKSAGRIRDRFTNAHRSNEIIDDRKQHDCDQVPTKSIRDNPSFPKNVFVKTKRMIFGPFRRSEDRSSLRKESDSSIDSRLLRSKSKSKSRSSSPKLSRQDSLLRVSLSLPWPLRSASKDKEIPSEAESRKSSGSKTNDTAQEKNSLCEENNVDNKKLKNQLNEEESLSANERKNHHSDTNACAKRTIFRRVSDRLRAVSLEQDQSMSGVKDEIKYNQTRDDGEQWDGEIKRNQVQFEEKRNEEEYSRQQNEGKREEMKFDQDETKQQDENQAKCDAISSDLMHKLRILSDAAAKREGRVTESAIIDSSESRSSRIRRAKESFLSQGPGGPFCRSMMGSADTVEHEISWGPMPTNRTSIVETTATRLQEITTIASKSEETDNRTNAITMQDETASLKEHKVDACRKPAANVAVRPESLVKSASAGMINIDPATFGQLATDDRGCESLSRTIVKRRDSFGPLAKIVGKLKISRLIRARNNDGGNMSTVSTLCRQSLMINMQNDLADRRSDERKADSSAEAAKGKNEDSNEDDDEMSVNFSTRLLSLLQLQRRY